MSTVTYAAELTDDTLVSPIPLELADAGRSHVIVGPYGALVATMATPAEPQPYLYMPGPGSLTPPPSTRLDRAADLLALLPLAVWKRVALYSFLFGVLGNLLRCRGLAFSTNVACVALLVLGVAGCLASAQRNP